MWLACREYLTLHACDSLLGASARLCPSCLSACETPVQCCSLRMKVRVYHTHVVFLPACLTIKFEAVQPCSHSQGVLFCIYTMLHILQTSTENTVVFVILQSNMSSGYVLAGTAVQPPIFTVQFKGQIRSNTTCFSLHYGHPLLLVPLVLIMYEVSCICNCLLVNMLLPWLPLQTGFTVQFKCHIHSN